MLQSTEFGQLGRIGKIVTLRVAVMAVVGWFANVTATVLRRSTMAKTVEKTTVNIRYAQSTAVVYI